MNDKIKKSLWNIVPILIGISIIAIVVWIKIGEPFEEGAGKILTSSTLMDTIDISEFSTAKFTYNGVAVVYKDDEQKNVKCHIRYFAEVKAFIDMQDIQFVFDYDNFTVKPILPELEYKVTVADEEPLSYIPDDAKIDLQKALLACEEDAFQEATKSEQLRQLAEENLRNTVEALIYPIVNYNGYTVVWE